MSDCRRELLNLYASTAIKYTTTRRVSSFWEFARNIRQRFDSVKSKRSFIIYIFTFLFNTYNRVINYDRYSENKRIRRSDKRK